MNSVIKVLYEIKNTSGKNDKKDILEDHIDNELLQKVLIFTLDKNIVTNISKAKIKKTVEKYEDYTIETFEEFLDFLENKCTGKNIDIAVIQDFINRNSEHREFLTELSTKDFKYGMSAKSVNKIKEIIPVHDIMLGKNFFEEFRKLKDKYPGSKYFITQKLDGIRGNLFTDDDILMSRQGKLFKGVDHIIADMKKLGIEHIMFDGELMIPDMTFNQIQSVVMADEHEKKELIKLRIFDFIDYKGYKKGKGNIKYDKRRTNLNNLSNMITKHNIKTIEVVPLIGCYNYDELEEALVKIMNSKTADGWEGLMVNVGDAVYECKRSFALLKVKEFYNIDVRITGYEEGNNSLSGTCGSLVCEYGEGAEVKVAGIAHKLRDEFWNNQDKYMGRMIEVKYFEESEDKNGKKSLRHPSFVRFRDDKN